MVGHGRLAWLERSDPDESKIIGNEPIFGPAPMVGREVEAPATASEQKVVDRISGGLAAPPSRPHVDEVFTRVAV